MSTDLRKHFLLLFISIGILIAVLPWFLSFAIDPLPAMFHPTQTAMADIQATEIAESINSTGDDQASRTSVTEQSGSFMLVGTATPISSADIAVTSSIGAASSSSPLLPSPIQTATPTVTPTQTATPTVTPTQTATPTVTPTPQPQVQGEASVDLATFSCPSSRFDSKAPNSKGEKFRVLGWNVNDEGDWLLIEDTINQAQVWVRLDGNVQVQPSDYKEFVPRIACRLI